MKISATKLFEAKDLDPKVRDLMRPFVDWVNTNFDQVIRALTKQLTIDDNLNMRRVEVELTHATAKEIEVPNAQLVIGIAPLRCATAGRACFGVAWSATTAGNIRVTAFFSDTAAAVRERVSLVVTYR